MIISGCHHAEPLTIILNIGDCEHGIVSESNISNVKSIFPEAQRADVLIAGGCYRDKFVKKGS